MSGPTSLWFVVWVCFLVRVSGGETDVTAKPGDTAVLPCPAEKNFTKVEWKRENVLVCETKNRDDIRCQNVSSSFMNRVQLKKDLKFGDASLILTNVTKTDAGKYECCVEQLPGGKRTKRNVDLKLSTVNLKIEQGGAKKEGDASGGAKKEGDASGGAKKEGDTSGGANAGHAGPVAAVILSLLVVVVVVVVVFYRNRGRLSGLSNNQPDAQQPLQSP